MKKPLLLVFCKNPVLGKVKTRLAASIGEQKALDIYQALLQKTAQVLFDVAIEIQLYYSSHIDNEDIFQKNSITKKVQSGNDLGIRMANAFNEGFLTHSPVVIIGTDLWTLNVLDIHKAFKALKTHKTVIGPSADGGYYLLGLQGFIPTLFKEKKWGSTTVLTDTLNDLKKEDVYLLEEKNDIDTYNDLKDHPELMQLLK
ncbi:TIGR04282 family arsenosugar biosynthesis glycosyltransferase [Flavobacteriaceae bacterium]|nr:TIGR04282 family arsenosugar biosynthesis glycosyltransferase [Flavobacteriaceae bacterium]